ncbi:YgaP family membrane protein [Roseovarius rhodophyticola]|uniref:DUF2892 domain-containing protein n=1 Tax=Roseovarius rhodophyticola TaxID=3080827 RepID=A0ABZ2TE86_9RHOB|nr:DUF2892 domain-containing protein [Roseovarius sp. W115]MDV2928276.1 DUF2892 domain-containing protein [Roseovarius sp. W115]
MAFATTERKTPMKRNVGRIDSLTRLVLGIILIIAPLANFPSIWSSAILSAGALIVGFVMVATAYFTFCPLYRVLGMSTCKVQSE